MAKLYNLARMTTATTGTGTITLGSAVTSYLSFASSGVSDGETVTYAIVDGNNREIGRGVYTASGTTLTRTVLESTNSNTAINLSGNAEVFITAAAEDIANVNETNTFTAPQIINVGSASTALRVTQTGAGNAIVVEDSSNPDTSPFVVTAEGRVSIGEDIPSFYLQVAAPNASTQTQMGLTSTNYTSDFKAVYLQYSDASTTGTTYGITNAGLGSLLFQNTSNALIGTNGSTPLIFGTLSLERFRVGPSGQLGIGGANYGTSGQFIKSAGSAAAPSWASITNTDVSGLGTMSTQDANNVSITGGSVTGITDLAVADGGTGASSFTAYSLVAGGTTSTGALQSVSGLGTSGQVLTSNGAGALPTWASPAAGSGALLRAPQILTTGTSYTTPAGCNTIYIELVGAGAGGQSGTTSTNGGGGGGAGAYAAKYFSVSPNTSYTYAIGAAGGATGGNTTFTVGATTVTAGGGSRPTTTAGGVGGTATNGDLNVRGGHGGPSGTATATPGGSGGASFFGSGGAGGATSSAGVTALVYGGGGGGGAFGNNAGGSGMAGVIKVWEYA